MVDVQCDMYANGQLVASNLKVWLHAKGGSLHDGMFHVSANLEVLTAAKYHLELYGERAKLLNLPGGHSMDILITEVSGQIACFVLTSAGHTASTS
jgi:hypothetical protein